MICIKDEIFKLTFNKNCWEMKYSTRKKINNKNRISLKHAKPKKVIIWYNIPEISKFFVTIYFYQRKLEIRILKRFLKKIILY